MPLPKWYRDELSKFPEALHEAITKRFGRVHPTTHYNFFADRHITTWKTRSKVKNQRIKDFIVGWMEGHEALAERLRQGPCVIPKNLPAATMPPATQKRLKA